MQKWKLSAALQFMFEMWKLKERFGGRVHELGHVQSRELSWPKVSRFWSAKTVHTYKVARSVTQLMDGPQENFLMDKISWFSY